MLHHPDNQYVRWQRGQLRTVSRRTFYVEEGLSEEDLEVVTTLSAAASTGKMLSMLRQERGALAPIPSRKLDDWKRQYINRALTPLGLDFRSEVPIDIFANLDVGFHTDAFSVSDSVFCAAVIAGPPRDVVFPQLGLRYTLRPGSMVMFDPALTHALLTPGATTFNRDKPNSVRIEDVTLFLSAELYLSEALRQYFQIQLTEEGAALPVNAHRPDMEDCSMATGLYRSQQQQFQ